MSSSYALTLVAVKIQWKCSDLHVWEGVVSDQNFLDFVQFCRGFLFYNSFIGFKLSNAFNKTKCKIYGFFMELHCTH